MNGHAENVVDLSAYRERRMRMPSPAPARSDVAQAALWFVTVPTPVLVPVVWFPWWTMVLFAAGPCNE